MFKRIELERDTNMKDCSLANQSMALIVLILLILSSGIVLAYSNPQVDDAILLETSKNLVS